MSRVLDLDAIRRDRGVDLAVWPPRYDPAYRPPPDAAHWLPEVECAPPAARDALILAKLRGQLRYAWERSPFYRRKWEAAGVSPATLETLGDLERFPVVTKEELRAAQAAAPPFGDYLCIPPESVARIHGTSGTTGRPTVFGVGKDDWDRIGEAHARILWATGIRPGDRRPDLLVLQPLHGLVGRPRRRRAPRRDGVPLRRRRAGPDARGGAMGARDPAGRLLRDAVLRAPLRRDRAARGRRSPLARIPGPLLLGRARGRHRLDQAAHRGRPSAASASTWAAWRR